jgi:uncharacterized membrane protein (Fun14 family)
LRIVDVLKTVNLQKVEDPMELFKTTGCALLQTEEVQKARTAVKAGITSELGYGLLVGYAGGYTVKRVSQLLVVLAGGALIAVRGLSHHGFISVNYDKLNAATKAVLDMNKDGKSDGRDLAAGYRRFEEMLGSKIPSGGGFAVGLAMGLCV